MIKNELKVFLASSSELELVRVHIGDFFNDINSILADTNVRVRLLKWEVFNPKFKVEGKQFEYNQQVKNSDVFIVLFRAIAGKYTKEEAEVASNEFKQNKKPKELYCFIQDCQEKRDFETDKLKTELGEMYNISTFSDIADLKPKIINIIKPHLSAFGVTITETEKFIKINTVNILRKAG